MKTLTHVVPIVFALNVLLLGGCAKSETAAPQSLEPGVASPDASDMGATLAANPFSVSLATDPAEVRAGKFKFIAKVSRDGSPVTGAKVRIQPEMPGHEMDVAEIALKETGEGAYEGEADLRMAGKWQAKVFVEKDGETGTATFRFEVKE